MSGIAIAYDNPSALHTRLAYLAKVPVWTTYDTALVLRRNVRSVRRDLTRGDIVGFRISREWRIPASQFSTLTSAFRFADYNELTDKMLPCRNPDRDMVEMTDVAPLQDPQELHVASGASRLPASAVSTASAASAASVASAAIPETTDIAASTCYTNFQPTSQTSPASPAPQAAHASLTSLPPSAAAVTQTSPPVLSISLLGQPRINVGDVRMRSLERSKRRSQVLYLLALHPDGLTSSQLAEFLRTSNRRDEGQRLTSHFVRTLVCGIREQARKKTGWAGIIESPTGRGPGVHYYRLPETTICDLWEFNKKLGYADLLQTQEAVLSRSVARMSAQHERTGNQELRVSKTCAALLNRAAAIREEAMHLYNGEFCEGSTDTYLVEEGRHVEECYLRAALQQADYWRAIASASSEMQAISQSDMHAHYGSHASYTASPIVAPMELHLDRATSDPGELGAQEYMATDSTAPVRSMRPELCTIWREAARNYERILQVDGYRDDACIYAMECYARLGSSRDIDRIFCRYRDLLWNELSETPRERVALAYAIYGKVRQAGRARRVGSLDNASAAKLVLHSQVL